MGLKKKTNSQASRSLENRKAQSKQKRPTLSHSDACVGLSSRGEQEAWWSSLCAPAKLHLFTISPISAGLLQRFGASSRKEVCFTLEPIHCLVCLLTHRFLLVSTLAGFVSMCPSKAVAARPGQKQRHLSRLLFTVETPLCVTSCLKRDKFTELLNTTV